MVNHFASRNDGEGQKGGAKCSVIKYSSLGEGRTRPHNEGTYERNGESKSEPRRGKYGAEGVEEVEAPLALQ